MSYDLMLKSRKRLDATMRESIFAKLRSTAPLSECELLVSEVSGGPDCNDLANALENGEVSQADFVQFCQAKELESDVQNLESARSFLQSKWGYDIATCCMPARNQALVTAAFAALRVIASSHDLILHDPQAGSDIAPSYGRPLPPGFYGMPAAGSGDAGVQTAPTRAGQQSRWAFGSLVAALGVGVVVGFLAARGVRAAEQGWFTALTAAGICALAGVYCAYSLGSLVGLLLAGLQPVSLVRYLRKLWKGR